MKQINNIIINSYRYKIYGMDDLDLNNFFQFVKFSKSLFEYYSYALYVKEIIRTILYINYSVTNKILIFIYLS